jgi:hypothetical protein
MWHSISGKKRLLQIQITPNRNVSLSDSGSQRASRQKLDAGWSGQMTRQGIRRMGLAFSVFMSGSAAMLQVGGGCDASTLNSLNSLMSTLDSFSSDYGYYDSGYDSYDSGSSGWSGNALDWPLLDVKSG